MFDKKILVDALASAVKNIFVGATLVAYEESKEGLHCDFDLPPLNPELFSKIGTELKALAAKNTEKALGTAAFELSHFSGAYEGGNAKNRMLQRIYVVAFETKAELEAYKERMADAAFRDHKVLGQEMKLYSSANEIGQGLILWHPKGAMLRYLLEQFGQTAHILNGYQWVYSPHIGRAELWKTSGHLDFYKDSMYSPIEIDGEAYFLKPMNCPFHIHIYNSELRSYRDLPIKYAEYGTVYRYELSGALSGLTRVRGFTQDDAHILCTPEQIDAEVENALKFSLYILRSFGLESFQAYISTKPKEKFIGDDQAWEMATEVLKKAVLAAGLDYKIDEGGGAFYGPKIDLKLQDSLGREWQCSTIQFDFNLPQRFQMRYVGKDGKPHTPYMVHRALFGSLERFMALLIEQYKGDFPFWFAPVQFGIVPIQPAHNEYAKALAKELRSLGFRVSVNENDENMRSKIKAFEQEKVNYMLVIGDRELENKTFALRSRKDGNLGEMNVERLMENLREEIEKGKPRCIE